MWMWKGTGLFWCRLVVVMVVLEWMCEEVWGEKGCVLLFRERGDLFLFSPPPFSLFGSVAFGCVEGLASPFSKCMMIYLNRDGATCITINNFVRLHHYI